MEFLDRFSRKSSKYKILSKCIQWGPSFSMRTDRRTDGHKEDNGRLSQLCERRLKIEILYIWISAFTDKWKDDILNWNIAEILRISIIFVNGNLIRLFRRGIYHVPLYYDIVSCNLQGSRIGHKHFLFLLHLPTHLYPITSISTIARLHLRSQNKRTPWLFMGPGGGAQRVRIFINYFQF
jgi:hypothetical protein